MTNRKDMIDEALLRPGRLEIHVEIGLPDTVGRQNILKIHTAKIASAKLLADDVDLAQIAEKTPNFTGAELEGIVREARNFATGRLVDPKELGKPVKTTDFIIKHIDFENAIA
jgi:vesicle-fusing ATPase